MRAGPLLALARIQENMLEEFFSAYLPNSWGNSFQCEYMPRLYSHPRKYRKIFLANIFMYWFRARGLALAKRMETPNFDGPAML